MFALIFIDVTGRLHAINTPNRTAAWIIVGAWIESGRCRSARLWQGHEQVG